MPQHAGVQWRDAGRVSPHLVPTLCVGMYPVTLCVTVDAERPWRHSHAERGNELQNHFRGT
ncbi:hypothetical protein C1891_12555 [Pseudomonas sp. GW456-12-1-14-TSB6]|nr:hypothetical protein C1891_12555 [Pseudomonas sp. GW456-12-1-14-TSB6]